MMRCALAALLLALIEETGSYAAEPVPTEPSISTFRPGTATKFRLPCFVGRNVYPENLDEPLYFILSRTSRNQ